jgi:hypothetical protein
LFEDGGEVSGVAAEVTELCWVFRPGPDRPADVRALTGATVLFAPAPALDGTVEAVLANGCHVLAHHGEIVAEPARRG